MCRLPSHPYRFLPTITAGYMPCDLRERFRDLKEIAGGYRDSVALCGNYRYVVPMSDSTPGGRRPGHVNGIVLRRARLAKGMTLRDVSAECARRQCPIDASNLARAENNSRGSIGPRKIPVLLEVLGLSIEELIPDDEVAA
jgi:hypothetical protein